MRVRDRLEWVIPTDELRDELLDFQNDYRENGLVDAAPAGVSDPDAFIAKFTELREAAEDRLRPSFENALSGDILEDFENAKNIDLTAYKEFMQEIYARYNFAT